VVLVALAKAENRPIPIAKYVKKIANENKTQARSAFFLSLYLLKIVESKRSITANAQGLILSEIAAGNIIPKKLSLSLKEGS
jgi:hypothetical protein